MQTCSHLWQIACSDSMYLFTASQIHQVEFAAELLLRLSVLLFDVYQEDAVTPGAVLVHVYTKQMTPMWSKHVGHQKKAKTLMLLFYEESGSKASRKHLTCNCYVSVRFAFINCVHHLVRAADKPFSAALCRKYRTLGYIYMSTEISDT